MTQQPLFHPTGEVTEYSHWYTRRDENGEDTRHPDDTPGTLFARVSDELLQLEQRFTKFLRDETPDSRKNDPAYSLLEDVFPDALKRTPDNLALAEDVDVLVAVIDTDIPLGHRAFRYKEGGSRTVYHWAMGQGEPDDSALIGQEYVTEQIDNLLATHSGGSPDGDLDQDAFNRAIGAVDFDRVAGTRALQSRYSHGAHMLDVAAGVDPDCDEEAFAKRVGIITVSMPSRWEFGEGGEFVDTFMLYAVFRVWAIVQRLREKSEKPLPCAVSLAFGRQAGSKRNDLGLLAQLLAAIEASRGPQARFDLVMPVGNDNLDRVVARYDLMPGKCKVLEWNILPSDQTDNHLEVWSEVAPTVFDPKLKLSVNLVPPDHELPEMLHCPDAGNYWDVARQGGHFGARVYRIAPRVIEPDDDISKRYVGYLFAIAPSEPRSARLATMPAGRWKVMLRNDSEVPLQINVSVQTDQSILPVAGVSSRSYLNDPTYEIRDAKSNLIDSVKFDGEKWVATDNPEGVRRRGTINAAASQTFSAVVGGYRMSDGTPAHYSTTGATVPPRLVPSVDGKHEEVENGRNAPDAMFPTDDTPALGGRLAAGSVDGSRVAMRGTSFAASQATRLLVERWLADPLSRRMQASLIMKEAGAAGEGAPGARCFKHAYDPQTSPEGVAKFGQGRAEPPRSAPSRITLE